MAIVTNELLTPSLIENTIMYKKYIDGVHKGYSIKAIDGYVLHDNTLDYQSADPETGDLLFDENGNELITLGYATGTVTCAANYDFVTNPREFYTVPENTVPADQIFGGGNEPEHEVM